MDTIGVIQCSILILLLFLSAFFSSAETALSTVTKVRMKALEEDGNKKARLVIRILDQYSKMISAILIGNNIVNIVASALTTTLAMNKFGISVGIATGLLTITILLAGEIIPKTWARINAEKICLSYCRVIYAFMVMLTPIIFLVDKVALLFLKLLRVDPAKKMSIMTETELKTYVDVSHEDGVIESEEREMIYNVFKFSDALAKDIMIPRINMVTVNLQADYEQIMGIFRESMYTRLPVYQDGKDNIVGIINIKDFILTTSKEAFEISQILRDAHYTYEYKKSADLMFEMLEKAHNVTFVLDEYGDCVGMITLEDLLEEIVGEIRDEYDADEEELIQKISENSYLVEGSMKLDDVNDVLNIDLSSNDYDSIGGILIEALERLPKDGEEVVLENQIRLMVKGIDQNRILHVLVTLPVKENSETLENKEA
ncbi:MAG: hemolysin family protein [Lachnospiraceae bacterium]|nr:hemolysin family protein [Lachnospiraceae bacterium]